MNCLRVRFLWWSHEEHFPAGFCAGSVSMNCRATFNASFAGGALIRFG
jgi:hypothetical protein